MDGGKGDAPPCFPRWRPTPAQNTPFPETAAILHFERFLPLAFAWPAAVCLAQLIKNDRGIRPDDVVATGSPKG